MHRTHTRNTRLIHNATVLFWVSLYINVGTGSFLGVKSGWGVTLTPHPLLVPWSWKCRAIPLLPLWAVRPVQSLSACTRVHFTLLLPTVHKQFIYQLPQYGFFFRTSKIVEPSHRLISLNRVLFYVGMMPLLFRSFQWKQHVNLSFSRRYQQVTVINGTGMLLQ